MAINTLPINSIAEAHLRALIENGVPESCDLEFKRDPIGRDDAAKKEFLKDISALANTAGGDLIIGMAEDDGTAASLHGITTQPEDEEIRRLESILQDGLEPRLVGTRMWSVPLATGGYVLIIRVRSSWNAPHRVVYQRTNRFYARNAAGAYELGVEQLRAAFLGTSEIERRLSEFRVERLARFKGGIGTTLVGPGQLILHIAPVQPPSGALDLRSALNNQEFQPLAATGWNTTPNFDGVLLYTAPFDESGSCVSLTQVFRNGCLEAGRGAMTFVGKHFGKDPLLSYAESLKQLIQALPCYIRALAGLGVSSPMFAMVSLLDVGGSVMGDNSPFPAFGRPLDRDDLLFQPILFEDLSFGEGWQRTLRPMLDAWWNAYGRSRCTHLFNDQGEWRSYPRDW